MSVGAHVSKKFVKNTSAAFRDKYLPRKKPKPAPIEWMQQVQYLALVRAAKRKLVIGYHLHEGVWFALALETDGDDVTSVLASHGHKVLGKFKTQDAARLACEKFAKNWCGLPGMSKCECGPILPPPSGTGTLAQRRATYRRTRP
jgi:hypothetical protein